MNSKRVKRHVSTFNGIDLWVSTWLKRREGMPVHAWNLSTQQQEKQFKSSRGYLVSAYVQPGLNTPTH